MTKKKDSKDLVPRKPPASELISIVQAATRHGSPREIIINAIQKGKVRSWGKGYSRRVSKIDIDDLPKYEPPDGTTPIRGPSHITCTFTLAEWLLISYSFTVARALHERGGFLSKFKQETLTELQKKFARTDLMDREQ